MSEEGYKTAFKATTIFGGVQFINIIFSVLKTKIIVLFLGPAGYGMLSLFNSTTTLVISICNMGIPNSSVREIANVYGDKNRLPIINTAIHRLIIAAGILGLITTIILSPLLSKWTFGTNAYLASFILLSFVVFLNILTAGNNAVIQGCSKITYLAKSNIIGSLISLLACFPIFFYFQKNSIIPYLIVVAFLTYALSSHYYTKLKKNICLVDSNQTLRTSYKEGINTLRLGVMMAINGIIISLVEFIIKTYITRVGGIEDVGLYQAGWAINGTYLGMVFTAMSTDYFPRLSRLADDNIKLKIFVNQQAEIALLILGPLIMGMILFLPICITVLYSNDFLIIESLVEFLLLGSIIKAGSWSISYIFLAKGAGKIFLINEIGIQLIILPSYLVAYSFWGISGIGYAFLFYNVIYFIEVSIVASRKYQINNSHKFWKILFFFFFISSLSITFKRTLPITAIYVLNAILLITSICFSTIELNRRINLIQTIKNYIKQ